MIFSPTPSRHRPPGQAVILAGGRGLRMRPLTDTRPKPMIDVCGRPFMEHVVAMLRDQGIEQVLMLLGYLPEVIQDYFGDGRQFGIDIQYSVSSEADLTVERMRKVKDRLASHFLLLYCDNYWPMDLRKMWKRYSSAGALAMITVYSNRDGYSRDSVLLDKDDYVVVFDRERVTPGLQGVEISYAILDRAVMDLLPQRDALFEQAVYPQLASQHQLLGFVSDHRYYGVGSMERLAAARDFFSQQPTVLLDRDGVLNRRPPRGEYVRSHEEFIWLDGAKDALRLFSQAGYRIVVVSNQAGVGRGVMSGASLARLHEWMKFEAVSAGAQIDAVYCCPHDWNAGCPCRKPKPGMLFQAQHDFNLDLRRTVFIGDDETDAQAAELAGTPFRLLSGRESLLDVARSLLSGNLERQEELEKVTL